MRTSQAATRGAYCPPPETLGKLLREELSPADAPGVEEHVGGCPRCQQVLGRLVGSLPDLVGPLTAPRGPAADEEPPALPGYALVGRIDAGGMGVVWRVHDLQFRRRLAVKVMKSSACASPVQVERFVAEARVCGQLAHPFIVPVHAMGRLPDGRPYYTMKLVEGQTLAALLAGGPAAAARRTEFVQVFGQVCQAVAHAHSKGVIHRDLKPRNVMVGAHGEVQLMDWGLAKELDGEAGRRAGEEAGAGATLPGKEETTRTRAGSVLGTLAYMAPEQARGLVAEVDRRSDVFGLGAILCEILTGAPPYDGPDVEAIHGLAADADLGKALARLRNCGADPELVRLAERCLAPRKADRPADAGEVAAAVAAHLSGVEERLHQERLQRERRQLQADEDRRRRRLWLSLAAAVLAAVGLGAGGWLYWQGQRAQRHLEASQALGQAEAQLRAGDFAAAEGSLTRAKDRLGGDGPARLTAEHDRLQAEWQFVQDVRRIEQERTTLTDEGLFDNDAAQKGYARKFAEAGYDLGDPEEAARRVRASPVAGPALEAIDNWALVCAYDMRFVPKQKEEYRRRRDRLLEMARAADPDPGFRDKVRDPRVWDDRRQLEGLAELAPRTGLSPRLAALLAELLRLQGGNPERVLRAFQSRHPGDFWLNFDLGKWLGRTKPAESLQFYQAALAVRPHHVGVQFHIGSALGDLRRWDEAVAAFQEALARIPEGAPGSAGLRANLAEVLRDRGDIGGAVKLLREIARRWPNQVAAHLNLGWGLQELGRCPEAVESFRRARQLAAESGGKADMASLSPRRAEQLVREAERRAELQRRLETGKPEPSDAGEELELAVVCFWTKRYADAAGFYRRALARGPKVAEHVRLYSAACAAALAAAGGGEGAEPLDDARRAGLRKQALTWLREDLDTWGRRARDPKTRPGVEAELRLWLRHPNLAGLRDPAAIAGLPADERRACEQLWADVTALLSKVQPN